jgi:lipooligosaccharide transport system permease protein
MSDLGKLDHRGSLDQRQLPLIEGTVRQLDYWWTLYVRTWQGTLVSSFFTPLFYVLAMGVLLGGFIEGDPDKLDGASSYLAFVVPGLIASQTMQTAIGEVTYPVMAMLKWHRSYYAMSATPLAPIHLAAGTLMFALFRVASTSAVFIAVLVPFGVFATWWSAIAVFLVQILLGMAFAACVYAFSVRVVSDEAFGVLFRLVVFPLFLFSGAFFPIENLGPVLAWAARLTPLWHGVNLSRMFAVDQIDWSLAAVHVAVLFGLLLIGWVLSVSGLAKRLAD